MTIFLTTTGVSLYFNTKKKYNQEPSIEEMRQYLRTKPEQASAEANSLLKMATHEDHLILLHTKTPNAIQCAELLVEYFKKEGHKHVRKVELEFQDDPKHIETTGLRNFINTLINEIEKAQRNNQEVVINATAGFKALVVYSTMIGMIYQVPVKYIYEDFRSVVTFNSIALDWNTNLFQTYERFFRWIDDAAQTHTYEKVEQHLKGIPDRESIKAFLTPPDENGEVFLTYMGNALYQRFQRDMEEAELVAWPPSAEIPNPEDKIATSIRKRNHHPVKGDLEACRKIAAIDCVEEIMGGFYENTTRSAVKPIDPDGGIILLLWADGEKAARFTISTTAKGKPQTLKVIQKIKEIVEIQ